MKRYLLILALVYTFVCLALMPLHYKKIVKNEKIDYPSHIKQTGREVAVRGRVIQENLEKEWVYIKTEDGKTYQVFYKNLPDFEAKRHGKHDFVLDARKPGYASPKNFSGFDNDKRLFADGVDGVYTLKSYSQIHSKVSLMQKRLLARANFSKWLTEHCPEHLSAFYKILLLGDKSDFKPYDTFKDLGLAHLFAISGLHFGLIYGVLNKLLMVGNRYLKHGLILFFLGLFLFWIGFSYSAMRAFFIILYVSVGKCLHKPVDLKLALAFSCILILALEPRAVLSSAFQLSFFAYFVVSIVLESGDKKWVQGLKLQFYLMPPTIYFFGKAHVLSFLMNLVAIPAMGILLPASILHLALLMSPLKNGFHWMTFLMDGVVRVSSSLLSKVPLVFMPNFFTRTSDYIFAGLWLFLILVLFTSNVWSIDYKKWISRLTLLLVVCCVVYDGLLFALCKGEISFVDVGHGDGAVITSKGHTFVIDLGDTYFDMGNYLIAKGIKSVEGLVISHAHKDHHGGLEKLLSQVEVKKVFLNQETLEVVRPILEEFKTGFLVVDQQMQIKYGHIQMDVMPFFSETETNDNMLFVALSMKGIRGDFTGDLHKEKLNQLSGRGEMTFIKIPHHGSKTSLAPAYYESAKAQLGIISHGAKHGLPDEVIVELLAKHMESLYSTYYNGEVKLSLYPWGMQVKTYLNNAFYK